MRNYIRKHARIIFPCFGCFSVVAWIIDSLILDRHPGLSGNIWSFVSGFLAYALFFGIPREIKDAETGSTDPLGSTR